MRYYKLHPDCSVAGFFESIDISKAFLQDIHSLKDINNQLKDCVLIAGKGYLSENCQIGLFQSASINLQTPMRINQKKL